MRLKTPNKIAATLVLGKDSFAKDSVFFSLFVSLREAFFVFKHLQKLWIPLAAAQVWNHQQDSVLAVGVYSFCPYRALWKSVRVAPAHVLQKEALGSLWESKDN